MLQGCLDLWIALKTKRGENPESRPNTAVLEVILEWVFLNCCLTRFCSLTKIAIKILKDSFYSDR